MAHKSYHSGRTPIAITYIVTQKHRTRLSTILYTRMYVVAFVEFKNCLVALNGIVGFESLASRGVSSVQLLDSILNYCRKHEWLSCIRIRGGLVDNNNDINPWKMNFKSLRIEMNNERYFISSIKILTTTLTATTMTDRLNKLMINRRRETFACIASFAFVFLCTFLPLHIDMFCVTRWGTEKKT